MNSTSPKFISLYVVSTPWNLLNAIALATHKKKSESAYLLFIDQTEESIGVYGQHLQNWVDTPFNKSWCFIGKTPGLLRKYKHRLSVLDEITRIVRHLRPSRVYTGNDRRIEFQRAMTEAVQLNPSVVGGYLDDGLFTYEGDGFKKGAIHGWLATVIMSKLYGVAWKQPITVGASDWINESWVLMPQKANEQIKSRSDVFQIQQNWYQTEGLKAFALDLLGVSLVKEMSQEYEALLLLPNQSNIAKAEWNELQDWLKKIKSDGKRIIVKRHPKDKSNIDSIIPYGVDFLELPRNIAFEFMLPFLSVKTIIGGKSTASLTASLMCCSKLVEINNINRIAA